MEIQKSKNGQCILDENISEYPILYAVPAWPGVLVVVEKQL